MRCHIALNFINHLPQNNSCVAPTTTRSMTLELTDLQYTHMLYLDFLVQVDFKAGRQVGW